MSHPTDIKAIRPKVYAVLRKAGVGVATSHASRIRGWRTWSRGVVLSERGAWAEDPAGIDIVARYDVASAREQDVARAVAALRAAGYDVRDDGRILAVPS